MEKALVLGASGGMGYSIVKELLSREIKVVAFARTRSKLEQLFSDYESVEIIAGDIFQVKEVVKAAKGVDVIFQAANIPYPQWESQLIPMMRNILTAAEKSSARLAIVDNIYAYGRSQGDAIREDDSKNPHTKKGRIRLSVERLVKESPVEALIAHFPDFYGPNAENTLLHYTLQKVLQNKRAGFVGNQEIPREFIYTPDGAKALVQLALEPKAYGQNWNIPGSGVISGKKIIDILRKQTNYNKEVSTITKNMIRLLGFFNPFMREVVEMYYLNEVPVVLSGEKYEQLIGPLPRTSYQDGLEETINFMKRIS